MLHTCVREKTLNIIFQILFRSTTNELFSWLYALPDLKRMFAEIIHHIDLFFGINKYMFKYKAMEMGIKCIMFACRCYLKLSASPKKCTDLL